jgi:hypothetical protein
VLFVIFAKSNYNYQVEDVMGGACNANVGEEDSVIVGKPEGKLPL